ncbi:hypothetical protein [Leptospira ryugenii]|nr:hypothetical protein [Leptospira ryugenii]
MIPSIIEIFWIEKLRFTQYCFQKIASISREDWERVPSPQAKSVAWAVSQMAAFDRNFAFYLPASMALSTFFFRSKIEELDIEKDLVEIRDKFTPPAFPLHFLDISIQRAADLKIPESDRERTRIMKEWRMTLVKIEEKLGQISEAEAYKKRYTSLTGIYTIPGAINHSTEFCHRLWNEHIVPFIKSES